MDDLTQWLSAQLDEDERAARAATLTEGMTGSLVDFLKHEAMQVDVAPSEAHYARHTPVRVLREIDAKRQIVREWEDAKRAAESDPSDASARVALLAFGITLRLHAAVYDARPGYREEWRP
ncbi:DUF6221 family protein [Streptomyces sp. NPDC088337]|uniref:DUF6221 family protein n=1 Tax=unclassified Streptomyces TaxID=2593676 RepID=UPI00380B354C